MPSNSVRYATCFMLTSCLMVVGQLDAQPPNTLSSAAGAPFEVLPAEALPIKSAKIETVAIEEAVASAADGIARLRIPVALLENLINRDFTQVSAVDRTILGTRSQGTALCRGNVTSRIVDNQVGVEVLCCIAGSVESTTRGKNGPALIDSQATTTYTAHKAIVFDGRAFTTRPVQLESSTSLAVTGIGSTVPGVRGRIVRNVAARRAGESQAEALAITTQLTRDELAGKIEDEFNQRVKALNEQLTTRLKLLSYFFASGDQIKIRRRDNWLEVTLAGDTAGSADADSGSQGAAASAGIELWLMVKKDYVAAHNPTLDSVMSLVPSWLSAHFSERPQSALQKEKTIEVASRAKWLVITLKD